MSSYNLNLASGSGLITSGSGILSHGVNSGYLSNSFGNAYASGGLANSAAYLGSGYASAITPASGAFASFTPEAPRRSILRSRSLGRVMPASGYVASHSAVALAPQAPLVHSSTALNLSQYQLNQDPNPIIIRRKPAQPVRYQQNVSVKFLKPPPLPPAGDIVVRQERDVQAPAAPPHHIVQRPPAPVKPAPQIIRERPPLAPPPIAPEFHSIPGRVIPPPPRKVIVEQFPTLPTPPQDVIVERWLEYPERLRRVVYQPAPPLVPAPAPKNLHIIWDTPAVSIHKEFRNLGIVVASPSQYAAQHGASLVHPSQIPAYAQSVRPPNGELLAVESAPKPGRLVGAVHALNLVRQGHAAARVPAYETPYTPFGSSYGAGSASLAVAAPSLAAPFASGSASGALSAAAPAAPAFLSSLPGSAYAYGSGSVAAPAPAVLSAHAGSAFAYGSANLGPAAAYGSGALLNHGSGALLNHGSGAMFNHGSGALQAYGSGAAGVYASGAPGSASAAFASGSAFGSAGAVLDRGLGAAHGSAFLPGAHAGAYNFGSFNGGISHGLGQAFGSGMMLANDFNAAGHGNHFGSAY